MIATIPLAGEMAGLATACLWACSALAWSLSGRRVGAVAVSFLRIALASLILAGSHLIGCGSVWPGELPQRSLWLLVVSGALGAGVADMCFFRGLVLIGPRLGTLVLSQAPVLTSVLAYLTPLGEALSARAVVGIALTVGGVAWVVSERRGREAWRTPSASFGPGVGLCLAAAVLLAVSMVLAKMAMKPAGGVEVSAYSAALVRVVAGTCVIGVSLPLLGRTRATLRALRDGRTMGILLAGTIVGPVLGTWMSMTAVKYTQTGVASALIGTSPVMMIPLAYLAYGERPSGRTLVGTSAAVAGIAVLMLRGV